VIVNIDLRTSVLLSVQRALVGEITREMRAVSVEWSAEQVLLRVFTDGALPEQAKEDFDAGVVTQVIADLPFATGDNPRVDVEFIQCDPPASLPPVGEFVFGRAES
jgi:hypothetical protein